MSESRGRKEKYITSFVSKLVCIIELVQNQVVLITVTHWPVCRVRMTTQAGLVVDLAGGLRDIGHGRKHVVIRLIHDEQMQPTSLFTLYRIEGEKF